MKIAVLGTSMVGQSIAERLLGLGHEVLMGTREPLETMMRTEAHGMTGKSFADWYKDNSEIKLIKFEDLHHDLDLVVNATNGAKSVDILKSIGGEKLEGKVILDLANGLDFSNGMPPSLLVCNTDSLGEQIQNALPKSHVVKSLNTMNADIMVRPNIIDEEHNVFVCGNESSAKKLVSDLLGEFGWGDHQIIDLGDIKSARATEMMLPVWLKIWGVLGTAHFNFKIVKA